MKKNISIIFIFLLLFLLLSSSLFSQDKIMRGLGYSYLLHSRKSGNGTGSFETLIGEGLNNQISSVFGIEPSGAEQSVSIVKAGDLNGDAMDEIVAVYHSGTDINGDGLGDNSRMIVMDGSYNDAAYSGILFEKMGGSEGFNCYLVEIGDFDGDGKDEIAHARHASDADYDGDGFKDGTYIEILDEDGSIIGTYTAQAFGTGIHYWEGVQFMRSGDFNGDGYDDLALVHYLNPDTNSTYEQSILRIFDIHNSTILFEKYSSYGSLYKCYMLDIGNFDNNPMTDEVVFTCHYSSCDYDGDGNGDGTKIQILKNDGTSDGLLIRTYYGTAYGGGDIQSWEGVRFLKIGDFDGDSYDELALIHYKNPDRNNIYDQSVLRVFDVISGSLMFLDYFGPSSSYLKCYILDVGNFDDDPTTEEIVHARHSSDYNYVSDGNADGTFIQIFNGSGNIIGTYTGEAFGSEVNDWEGVLELKVSDFNGDAYDDLALLHYLNPDCDSDWDGSILRLFDIKNNNVYYNGLEQIYSERGFMLEVLQNDYTDEEMMKSISGYSSFSAYLEHFLSEPPATYDSFGPKEFYENGDLDSLIINIKNYSTISFFDDYYEDGWQKFRTNYVSGAAERLDRIYRTLLSRFSSYDETDSIEIKLCLKQMLSLLRLMKKDKYYSCDISSNHSVLYYNRQILFALPFFKDFREFADWRNLAEQRIENSIDNHVLDDGVHGEHAFSYGFYYMHTLGEIDVLYERNSSLFASVNYTNFTNLIRNTIKNMYTNFLYIVKPLESSVDITTGNHQIDLPIIGDSFAPIQKSDGWIGKLNTSLPNNHSILSYPISYPHSINSSLEEFIDPNDTLGLNLTFVANGSGGLVPGQVSKLFPSSGNFISRSSWVNGNNFDYSARYGLLRCNPFHPETSHPGHRHADLLSVELSGYGKNYIIDPGGYEKNNGIGESDFNSLYGYYPGYAGSNSDIDRARHYFIGTAGHNTVTINHNDQVGIPSHPGSDNYFQYFYTDQILYNELQAITTSSFDLSWAGYYKDYFDDNEFHNREMLYIKPNNDYWVIFDNIGFNSVIGGEATTEQIWHIAPPTGGEDITFDTSGIVKVEDSFWIIPLETDISFSRSEVNAYYSPLPDKLVSSKVVKYGLAKDETENFSYLTVIFPFPENKDLTAASIEKINIYNNTTLAIANDSLIQSYKFNFTIGDSSFVDTCIVSHKKDQVFYWIPEGENKYTPVPGDMLFYRYNGSNLVRNSSLDYENLHAELPYSTGFEGGFDRHWQIKSSNSYGRVQIRTTNTPHSGNQHLTMDVNTNGHYSTNEAWLCLDLSDYTIEDEIIFSFYWKDFGDETHSLDGVYLSDNGGVTFTKVINICGASYRDNVWIYCPYLLNELVDGYNLSLSDSFIIKFQQYDDYSIPTDGLAFDDISITGPSLTKPNIGNIVIDLPTEFNLQQNYPNPFNNTTTINYALKEDSEVKIMIYNCLGENIQTLVNERQQAGYKSVIWNGKDKNGRSIPSGLYFSRMIAGDYIKTSKMILLK
ncbi:MAG: heparinase II/III family protein [bacterium]